MLWKMLGSVELRAGAHRSGRARHRSLGKLDPSPDVHVDDDGNDLEDLLRVEVLGEPVVEALERPVSVRVGGAGKRLAIAERRLLGLRVKRRLPPRGQRAILARGMPASRAAS